MAIGFTNLGASANPDIADGTDLDSYSTSSWVPPSTGIIIAACYFRQLSPMTREFPVASGNSLTWHLIGSNYDLGGSVEGMALFAAFASGSSTGATTFDFNGRTAVFLGASFFQVTGAYESGTIFDAFVQIITASATSGTSGTVTLAAAADSNSRPFSVFGHNQNETKTPRTNWTELDDLVLGSSAGLESQYRTDAWEATASASWSSSGRWIGMAVEVRDSGFSAVAGYHQDYWQLRVDDTAALNDDDFDGAENTGITIPQGQEFRVRIKVRRNTTGISEPFTIQCRHETAAGVTNSWEEVSVVALSTSADTCVSGKLSGQYADGAATSTELLTSIATYTNGEGVETANETGDLITGSYDLDNLETEFEWCLQIGNTYGAPSSSIVKPGDKIYLRVVRSGTPDYPFQNLYDEVEITVGQNNGYIGATRAEKPNKMFWMDTNDNLYYFCEDSETHAQHVMLKSSDRGDTWDFFDHDHRPGENDLESLDGVIIGTGLLKAAAQLNDDPFFYEINLSDAASNPDTWQTEQVIETPVTRSDQVCALVWRSDGTAIAFYEEAPSDRDITYRIRSAGGAWGADNDLDSEASTDITDVVAILGDNDLCHIFYIDNTNGKLYHNTITSGDSLGSREEVGTDVVGTGGGEENAIAGVIRYDSSGTDRIVCAFKGTSNDHIFVTKVDDDGSPGAPVDATDATVRFNPAGGSDMSMADIVVEGTDIYILYAQADGDIFITKSADYASFDTDVEIENGADTHILRAIMLTPSAGGKYIGYIYEKYSSGGNGQGWYKEYEIEAAAVDRVIVAQKPKRSVQVPIAHLSI